MTPRKFRIVKKLSHEGVPSNQMISNPIIFRPVDPKIEIIGMSPSKLR